MIDSDKIRAILREKDMTQSDLARGMGVHTQTIVNRLSKKNWRMWEVKKMVDFLECLPTDITEDGYDYWGEGRW